MFDLLAQSVAYVQSNPDQVWTALREHLWLSGIPLLIGMVIALPLGWLSSRFAWAGTVFINGFNTLRVIPSLAILFLSIPYLGLTVQAAVVALTILVIPPMLISTDVAFRGIDPAIREAAYGMGMPPRQVLTQVDIPLAAPVILAGIKTATVEVIASATLAAFIGAGGLGTFITLGFALYDNSILLVGAIPVALLAMGAEVGLSLTQRWVHPNRHG
ncbi:MAG: ABC transporter permease [Synechococcales cyanobacterium]